MATEFRAIHALHFNFLVEAYLNFRMILKSTLRQLAIIATLFPFMTIAQPANCPDYTTYSSSPQGNPSAGPLKLPFMRPSPECRTFNSSAVEVGSVVLYNFNSTLRPW